MQYTTAITNHNVAIADIEARAANDTDYNNSAVYFKDLEKARTASLQGFQNKAVQQKAMVEIDADSRISQIKVSSIFRKKQLAFGVVELDKGLEALEIKRLNAASPAELAKTNQDILELLDVNVKAGIISDADREKKIDKMQVTGVQYDIYSDPARHEKDSVVLKELRKGSNGRYGFLSAEERLDLIAENQRRIFQNNQSFKRDISESQNIRHDSILDKIADGILTFQDIDNELRIKPEEGGVPKKILVSYQKGLGTAIVKDLKQIVGEKVYRGGRQQPTKKAKKAANYLRLIDNFIDDKTDLWKAREYLADAYADGILNPKEAKFLNTLKDDLKDIEWNRSSKWRKGFIEAFIGKNRNLPDEELALKVKSLIQTLATTKNPEEAVVNFNRKNNIEDMPEMITFDEKGEALMDSLGRIKLGLPTGDLREYLKK